MPCRVPKRRFSCGAPQHLTKNHKKEDSALHCPLLSFFKKELEADSQFGPEGTSMLIVFLTLQVIVFNAGNHVLSNCQVSTSHVALEAFFFEFIIGTVHGMSNSSRSTLIIVFAIE